MRQIRAAGILIIRGKPIQSFLLMRHHDRWDLPKGHLDEGESDAECALRELREETGIEAADIELDPGFRFVIEYDVKGKKPGDETGHKTVVYFLGRLLRDVTIIPTEHAGYQWFPWRPPHHIQEQTIDPLLATVERHVAAQQ
jgi:bis(5'-nucleosidyl)-tetraphosphatase